MLLLLSIINVCYLLKSKQYQLNTLCETALIVILAILGNDYFSTNFYMTTPKTVFDYDFRILDSDLEFTYQKELTEKLDRHSSTFDQSTINEIVLWKVNRYASIDSDTLYLINSIDPNSRELDIEKTERLLKRLLSIKGIKLPMASTILKFKNKYIYQIIDQRVYRIIYKGKKLKLNQNMNEGNLSLQINLYMTFLKDLKGVCKGLNIPFYLSDRILFMADKRINKDIILENY